MSDKVPLWKTPSNKQVTGNFVENGHVSYATKAAAGSNGITNNNSTTTTIGGYSGGSVSINGSIIGGNIITRWCFHLLKCVNVRRCVAALVLLTVVTIVYYTHYVDNSPFVG